MADQDVLVTFGAKIDELIDATKQVQEQLGAVGGTTDKLAKQFGFLEEIPKKLRDVAHWAMDLAREMGEVGLRAERMEMMLGATGAQLSVLKSIAALSGTDFEALATSIERMSLNIQRSTRDALNPQAQALAALGLRAKDLIGLSPDQFFLRLADATAKFNPSLNLTNALMQIGGRNVAQIIPALLQGSEGIKQFGERWKAAGAGIDPKIFASTHLELTLLDKSVDSISKVLYAQLQPAIEGSIKAMAQFVQWAKEAIKEGGNLSLVMDIISYAAKALSTAFTGVMLATEGIALSIATLWKLASEGADNNVESAKKAVDQFEELGRRYKKVVDDIFRPSVTVHARPQGADVGAIDYSASDRLQAALKAAEAEVKLTQDAAERKKLLYQADAEQFRNTELAKIQLVGQTTQQTIAAEIATYQRILQMQGLTLAQRQEYESKITALVSRAETERLRSQLEFQRQYQQQWTSALTTISGAFNAQIDGLLQGTLSWANAFRNILRSLLTSVISFLTDWVAKWAAAQIAIQTSEEAARATGLPFKIATFESDLGAASAIAAANAYAALAAFPPAAAAAAAAAAGAVEGIGQAGIPKFDKGAWNIPHDMFAQIHAGEMIIPAAQAESVRNGGGLGGGGSMAFNINALDGASVARWLRGGGATMIADAVAKHWTMNPTARPAY